MAGGQAELKGKIFRIASMGNITDKDMLKTVQALEEVLQEAGAIKAAGDGLEAAKTVFAEL